MSDEREMLYCVKEQRRIYKWECYRWDCKYWVGNGGECIVSRGGMV